MIITPNRKTEFYWNGGSKKYAVYAVSRFLFSNHHSDREILGFNAMYAITIRCYERIQYITLSKTAKTSQSAFL